MHCSRRKLSSVWSSGTSNFGRMILPVSISTLHLSAISSVLAIASGYALPIAVGHLLGGLHVELVAGELHAARLVDRRAGADAQQQVLGLGVLAREVVDVVGRHQAQAQLAGERRELAVELRLAHAVVRDDALLLQLDVEVARREDAGVRLGPLAGLFRLSVLDGLGQDAAHARRRADEPLGVALEQLEVDLRLVVVARDRGVADERHEVAVALVVLREKKQVVEVGPTLALGPVTRVEVDLAADDRLDAGLRRRLVEVDRAVHVAVVGDRQRGHLEVDGLLDERLHARGAVEQRVLGVGVEVDEGHRAAPATLPAPGRGRACGGSPCSRPRRS